jgi:hypothetical protein
MTNRPRAANAIVMSTSPAGEAVHASMAVMLLNARTTSLAGVVACLGLGAVMVGAIPVAGQPPPQQVTSDTPEYCSRLLDRISELARSTSAPPSYEVTSLSIEGQRMCKQGQTRGGLLRLRRALALIQQQGDEPEGR